MIIGNKSEGILQVLVAMTSVGIFRQIKRPIQISGSSPNFEWRFVFALVVVLGIVGPAKAVTSNSDADLDASQSSESTVLPKSQSPLFDWSEELIGADVPEVGHRFTQLSRVERKSLRQGFKLPLDAIAKSDSTEDLAKMAKVRPLPDPTKPFIPVDAGSNASSNPFDSSQTVNDLGPLGRMFALEGRAAKTTTASATDSSTSSDPFASDDPFAGDTTAVEATNEFDAPSEDAASASETDPFGSLDGDSEEDPFGDF